MRDYWLVEEPFKNKFVNACFNAGSNDADFNNFRSDDYINCVIENTNDEWKQKALVILKEHDALLWDIYRNETPTMVRYAYTAYLLQKLVDGVLNKSIVEIGAGYGGMFKVIYDLYSIKSYTIYDLPEVVKLQQKFLFNVPIQPIFKTEISEETEHDLLISWCGWGELNYEGKKEYAEKVISKCKHFLICSNYNLPEDSQILSEYFDIKFYKDSLVENVIYA